MIALHRWIERSRRRRWLLPLVIVVLILFALVLIFHAWGDAAEAGATIACAVFGFLVSLVIIVVLRRYYLRPIILPARGPPFCGLDVSPFRRGVASPVGLIPLRL